MKILDELVAGFRNHARTSPQDSPGHDSESRQGESVGDRSKSHTGEADGSGRSRSSSRLIQILFRFVEEIIGSADSLIEVYADRIKLSVRRTIVQAVIGAGVAVCAAVWLGAASLAILRGVCGGLTTLWGGREWLGDLTGGLLALALAASTIALYLRLSSRRELGRLKAKYERIRNEHSQEHDTASRSGDRAGVA